MDIKKQIKIALGLEPETKLAYEAKSEDGTIFVSSAEELAVGVDISVLLEDGTTVALPAGTYKTEDGVTFIVEEEGVVAEIMEAEEDAEGEEVEAKSEADEAYEKAEFEDNDELDKHKDKEKEMGEYDFEEIERRMSKLEEEIEEMKKHYGKGKEEEMSEETPEDVERGDSPKTVTTKTTEVVEFSAEEEIEKLKAENDKLKVQLAESPADSPVNTNKFSSEKPVLTKTQYNRLSPQERFLYNLNK
tara:strand:- start:525 stop:1262 length:738 start_codon:yes stop_codon:yes gene_type:complete